MLGIKSAPIATVQKTSGDAAGPTGAGVIVTVTVWVASQPPVRRTVNVYVKVVACVIFVPVYTNVGLLISLADK